VCAASTAIGEDEHADTATASMISWCRNLHDHRGAVSVSGLYRITRASSRRHAETRDFAGALPTSRSGPLLLTAAHVRNGHAGNGHAGGWERSTVGDLTSAGIAVDWVNWIAFDLR
jgi:hypothetical protein